MVKKDYLARGKLTLGIMKVLLIIVLGAYIFFSPTATHMPRHFSTIFALVIIAYGIYRAVSIVQKYRNKEDNQTEDNQ